MSITVAPPEVEPSAAPELSESIVLPAPAAPNGAAAAALLACGIGCAFFGLVVLLNDASPWLHERLTFSQAVGPLSGKTVVGMGGWLVVWYGLHRHFRHREVAMAPFVRAARILVAVGFLLTFPPFYLLFAAD